jgi:hypothetical protein
MQEFKEPVTAIRPAYSTAELRPRAHLFEAFRVTACVYATSRRETSSSSGSSAVH